jgi:hypothetical protein
MKKILSAFTLLLLATSSFAYYYPNGNGYYQQPIYAAPATAYLQPVTFTLGGQIGGGGIQTPSSPTYSCNYWGYCYTNTSINSQSSQTFAYRPYANILFTVAPMLQIGPEVAYWGYTSNDYSFTTFNGDGNPNGNLDVNYSGYSIEYLLDLKYYFGPRVYIIGKAGAATVSQTVSTSQTYSLNSNKTPFSASTTTTQTLPEIAGGIGYMLGPNFGINFEVDYIIGSSISNIDVANANNNTVASVVGAMVGLEFTF